MEETLQNLEMLDPWVRDRVTPFCQKMLECLPGMIDSICLYGSAAVGDHVRKHSDINLLIIVDRLEFADLQTCLQVIRWGKRRQITAPLLLTSKHIETSLDAFPAEFLDMKEKHITLFGADPFPGISIDLKNLRLQCEQQVKGKLIRLRQAYLEIGSGRRHLLALLTTSLTSLLPILRNSLRLMKPDIEPPKTNEEIIRGACAEFGMDQTPFLTILRTKQGILKPDRHEAEEVFKGYLHNLALLAERIDGLKTECACK